MLYDETVRVCGRLVRTLHGHFDYVYALASLPGVQLASGSAVRDVITWRIANAMGQ